jgi:hypothetical protein
MQSFINKIINYLLEYLLIKDLLIILILNYDLPPKSIIIIFIITLNFIFITKFIIIIVIVITYIIFIFNSYPPYLLVKLLRI